MKKICLLLIILLFFTGCSATYELDINNDSFSEYLSIYSSDVSENDKIEKFPLVAYYGTDDKDDYGISKKELFSKSENIEYYNDSLKTNKDNLKELSYNYKFSTSSIKYSNLINLSFDYFLIKRYDSDNDGKNDYMLLSTSDNFVIFDYYDNLDSVIIKIKNVHKVISSNADEVKDDTYIWYLTKNNLKSINMVYDPDIIEDRRSFFEKYFNITFVVFLSIGVIGVIVYGFMKFLGKRRNKI